MSSSGRKDTLLVFLLLALTYGYFYHDSKWNGNSRFGLIFALVQEGRLTIDSFHDREGTETGDKALANGHYYSDKAIGVSALGALAYLPVYGLTRLLPSEPALGPVKYLLTFLVIGLPSALAGSLLYALGKSVTGRPVRAFMAAAAIALGTMCLPFSTLFFGHQLAAALLFGSFYLTYQLKVSPGNGSDGRLFLLGLLLGLALITEYTTAVLVLPLVAYYFAVWWQKPGRPVVRFLALPVLGGLVPVALLLAYNSLCFGRPLAIGYEHLPNRTFAVPMSQGLMGIGWPRARVLYYLTVHPAQGLFWQSPVLLLSLVGLGFMLRTRSCRAEAGLAGVGLIGYLLLNSGYFMWWGGESFGPRHLIPVLPFLGLPLLFLPQRLVPLAGAVTLVSIVQMFIVTAADPLTPDKFIKDLGQSSYFHYSAIYSACWNGFWTGHQAQTLGKFLLGLNGWQSLLLLFAGLAALTGTLLRVLKAPAATPTPGERLVPVRRQGREGSRTEVLSRSAALEESVP
jgi:hypothetical protein